MFLGARTSLGTRTSIVSIIISEDCCFHTTNYTRITNHKQTMNFVIVAPHHQLPPAGMLSVFVDPKNRDNNTIMAICATGSVTSHHTHLYYYFYYFLSMTRTFARQPCLKKNDLKFLKLFVPNHDSVYFEVG